MHQYISQWIKADEAQQLPIVIFTPNPEQIVLATKDAEFLAALQSASVLIPDGGGIVLASRLLFLFGKSGWIAERITGVDLMSDIINSFPEVTQVIIGGRGREEASSASAITIGSRSLPWVSGYQDVVHPTQEEESQVRAFITQNKPAVVFVAFGAPHQEYWALRYQEFLAQHGVKVVMVVGGSVDVLTGRLRRAPLLLRKLGLEWLYRLIQEPWRWKRQLRLLDFTKLFWRELTR